MGEKRMLHRASNAHFSGKSLDDPIRTDRLSVS